MLEGVVALPVSPEDAPFILPTSVDVSPTQEAVLKGLRLVYEEGIKGDSAVRKHLPDLFGLLVVFVGFGVKGPGGGRQPCVYDLESFSSFVLR